MTGRALRLVKHRAVIDRKTGKDIAREPEMKGLKLVFEAMTDAEKARTIDHLKGDEHDDNEETP